MICGHTKTLEMGYGFGAASGWNGIGITYRCTRCSECLWFEDDSLYMNPKELTYNDKKRLENIKYKPKTRSIHPKGKNHMSNKQINRLLKGPSK